MTVLVNDRHRRLFLGLKIGGILSLLVLDWVYCRSVTVKGVANMERIMGLNLVTESGSKV